MTSLPPKKLVLQSDFQELEKVEQFVEEGLKAFIGSNEELKSKVALTLSEAVTNAIIHGNQQKSHKKVTVTACTTDQKLIISIQDEGQGFDPSTLPDPLQEENLLKEGGRGVYLIRQYADELHFEQEGTLVRMVFNLK